VLLETNDLRLARRQQAFPCEHDAGVHELLVELGHRCERGLARHHALFAFLVRLHHHHDSHRRFSCWGVVWDRLSPAFTSATNDDGPDRHADALFFEGNRGYAWKSSEFDELGVAKIDSAFPSRSVRARKPGFDEAGA